MKQQITGKDYFLGQVYRFIGLGGLNLAGYQVEPLHNQEGMCYCQVGENHWLALDEHTYKQAVRHYKLFLETTSGLPDLMMIVRVRSYLCWVFFVLFLLCFKANLLLVFVAFVYFIIGGSQFNQKDQRNIKKTKRVIDQDTPKLVAYTLSMGLPSEWLYQSLVDPDVKEEDLPQLEWVKSVN